MRDKEKHSMTCEEYQSLLTPYSLESLGPDKRALLEAHLDTGCPECIKALKRVHAGIATNLIAAQPEQTTPGAQAPRTTRAPESQELHPLTGTGPMLSHPATPDDDFPAAPPRRRSLWLPVFASAALAAAITFAIGLQTANQLRQQLKDETQAKDKQLAATTDQINIRDKQLAEQKATILSQTQQMEQLAQQIGQQAQQIEVQAQQIDQLQLQLAEQSDQTDERAQQIATLKQQISSQSAKIAAQSQQLAAKDQWIDAQNQNTNDLADRLHAAESQLQTAVQYAGILHARDLQLVTLTAALPKQKGSGQVFWDRQRNLWQVHISDLAPPPTGRTYQLWFITQKQLKIPAGTFTIDATGRGQFTLPLPASLADLQAVAVTDEPAGGTPQPTGTTHLVGNIN